MKAVVVPRYGGPEVLELVTNYPDPVPGPDQVVVRVHATSLNHLDLFVREGIPALKLTLPHILGCDAAGDIAEVGSDVTDIEVGERVVVNPGISCGRCEFCLTGEDSLCVEYRILGEHLPGAYAEKVAVPARNVLRIPTDLEYSAASAAPLAFMTAWRMLVTRARVRPGEDVLVLGAGSGVSTAAIQVAKLAGCTVFTTSSSDEKLRKAKALGADVLINYKTMPWSKAVWELTGKRGVDVIVDHVGEATFKDSVRTLRRGGRVVVPGATTGATLELDARYLFWRQLSVLGSTMANQREFEEVMKLVFMGRLKPVVDRVFPLAKAREAHEHLARGDQFGKVVLAVD
ncbi:MAG TPA: zinc-binding dehydrogenase [Thermoplasmata archaeon]|nr:zinc-binding dehydrogenase [Thermoplasmata archaeon]